MPDPQSLIREAITVMLQKTKARMYRCVLVVGAVAGMSAGSENRDAAVSIAVRDFSAKGISASDAQLVSDRVRMELFRTRVFRVMEREEMESILEEQEFQATGLCDDDACLVKMGKMLGVNTIVVGRVGKIGRMYTLSARAIDAQTGEIVAVAGSDCQCPIEMVLTTSARDLAHKLAAPFSPAPEYQAPVEVPAVSRSDEAVPHPPRPPMRLGEMVRVPAGTFALGSEEGDGDEAPVRTVSVRSFVIDVHEVTQREYAARMGKAPSYFENCPACPVENVSWKEAKRFCEQGGKRLPTEAEWEYAARAGSETVYYWGDEFDERYAWYDGNSRGRTMPVGRKKPNRWGLYDMLGNVWEWCADRYARDYYEQGGDTDPRGPDRGSNRVVRGGAWYYGERSLRSANRESYPPDYRYRTIGFRCAADAPASTPEHNTPSRDSRSQSNH